MAYFLLIPLFGLFLIADPPAGTIKVKNYYVDKTEILNIHWVEYLRVIGKDMDSVHLQAFLPQQGSKSFALPENRFKPIVLITYDQALDYCQWRSEVVSKRYKKKITYRFPTPDEWKEIAQELQTTDASQTERELKSIQKTMLKKDGGYYLLEEEQPKEKIYHLFDNVSEMTLKKGVAMGMSNYDLYKLTNDTKAMDDRITPVAYSDPHPYLGFRCIAILEK